MSDDWYLDDDFWRNFGSLMFNDDTFARGAREVQQLLALVDGEPQTVLDLGCGPGRHALPLADAGLAVTAVDTSPTLLEQLTDALGDREIEVVEDDMRSFVRAESFDLVVVMWTSFGYFTDEADHARTLDNIRTSLKPGGRLLLDLVGIEYLCRNLEPVHMTEYDDGRMLIERPDLTDHMTRLDNQWMLIDGDRVHYHDFSHRVWSAGEIRRLLDDCGLAVVSFNGDYDGAEYDLDAERLIVVAERPSGRH